MMENNSGCHDGEVYEHVGQSIIDALNASNAEGVLSAYQGTAPPLSIGDQVDGIELDTTKALLSTSVGVPDDRYR